MYPFWSLQCKSPFLVGEIGATQTSYQWGWRAWCKGNVREGLSVGQATFTSTCARMPRPANVRADVCRHSHRHAHARSVCVSLMLMPNSIFKYGCCTRSLLIYSIQCTLLPVTVLDICFLTPACLWPLLCATHPDLSLYLDPAHLSLPDPPHSWWPQPVSWIFFCMPFMPDLTVCYQLDPASCS